MIRSSCRPPTLIDGMILIAATAIGFAGIRAETGAHYHSNSLYINMEPGETSWSILVWNGGRPLWFESVIEMTRTIVKGSPVLAAWTLALLLIRLRKPRPPLQRLSRQPGLVAEASASLGLAVTLGLALIQVVMSALGMTSTNNTHFYANSSFVICRTLQVEIIGMIVLITWLMLGMTGRWRRERGWIDGTGIAIGLGWLALLACQWSTNAYN